MQAAAFAEGAFQEGAQTGSVKAIMRRLQRGAHRRDGRDSSSSRASVAVGKGRGAADGKKKGARPCKTKSQFNG